MEKKRLMLWLILLALVVGFASGMLVFRLSRPDSAIAGYLNAVRTGDSDSMQIHDTLAVSVRTLQESMEKTAKLVTGEYYYTNVATQVKSAKLLKFLKSEALIVYSGKIGVGIYTNEITYDIDQDRQVIHVHLPELQVLSNEITEKPQFYDVKKSIFVKMEIDDYNDALFEEKEEQARKLADRQDFWASAKEHAKDTVRGMLSQIAHVNQYRVLVD